MDEESANGTEPVRRKASRPTKRQRAAAKVAAEAGALDAADARARAAAAAEAQAAAEARAAADAKAAGDGDAASRDTEVMTWARNLMADVPATSATEPVPASVSNANADIAAPTAFVDAASDTRDIPDVAEDEATFVRRRALGHVDTAALTVEQGAVGAAQTERLSIDRGALGAAMADRVDVSRGYARSILARHVQLDRAAARVVIAADVRADQSAAMLLIARKVDGNVRVLLDWRGALAFGAVAGVVVAVVSRARSVRGLRRRKR